MVPPFKFIGYLLICLSLLSCVRQRIATPPAVYDAVGTAFVTDPYVSSRKYGPPAHSVLLFKLSNDTKFHVIESYKYYGYVNAGEQFRIRYNSNDPSIYDIRFDEPVFSPTEELVRTEGGILNATNGDSANGLGRMHFVYEIDTRERDSSGSYYMSFKDKYQYIKTTQQQLAKRGRKYVVYYSKNRPKLAILYLDSIIDAVHTRENYLYYKAEVRMNQERYKRVITLLSKTLALDPTNEFALFGRGKAYYQLDKYSKAEKDFSTYISLHSDTYDGYWYRGMIRMKRGEYSLALEDLNKAIEINPTTEADLYYYRGMIYYNINNYEKAIEDYSKAIDINPGNGQYYYNRAAAKVKQSNSESEGDDDYREAARLGLKQSSKALNNSKSEQHNILASDIKKPWAKSYFSFTCDNGVMPYHNKAAYSAMNFPYQITSLSGKTTQGYYQHTTNFIQTYKAGFTTIGFEAGKSTGGYFISRAVFLWTRGDSWDVGWGRNMVLKNESVALLRPELTISYFATGYNIGTINYNGTLSVPGQTSPQQLDNSYANIILRDAIWSLKPRISLWLFPKNILSYKLNVGYVLPFAQITKYKVDFWYPNPNERYGNYSDSGNMTFDANYTTSSNIPLNKLCNISGFFFSIELALTVRW